MHSLRPKFLPAIAVMAVVAARPCSAQSALPAPSNATWVNNYVNWSPNPYVQCWSDGYFLGQICYQIGTWFCQTSQINISQSYSLTLGFEWEGLSVSSTESWTADQSYGPHTANPGERCAWFICYNNAQLYRVTCLHQFSFWTWTKTTYPHRLQPGDTGTVLVHCEPYNCRAGPERPDDSSADGADSAAGHLNGAKLTVDLDTFFAVTGSPPPTHPILNDDSTLAGLNTWQRCQIHDSIADAQFLLAEPIVELSVINADDTIHHFDLIANPNPFNLPLAPQLEQFDGYASGSPMHGQGGWRGWDNSAAAGAPVSSSQARSGLNSVEIAGAADLVHEYCTPGHGAWSYTAWQYIPEGFSSSGGGPNAGTYFILLDSYHDGGPYHWAVQMQADSNDGLMKVWYGEGLNTIAVPYQDDRWVRIRSIIDMDADWTRIYYDDALIAQYPWIGGIFGDGSGPNLGGGTMDVGAVDLFANGSTAVYYDDLALEPLEGAPPCRADCAGADDGEVDVTDLLALLAQWGGPGPCDTNGDGIVDVVDLLEMLAEWGLCPE